MYVAKRVMRLNATPHAIAAGVAAGVFASFTPFIGTHFVIAFIISWVIRGNLLAAAFGTFAGNPISFLFIWPAIYEIGAFVLGIPRNYADITILAETMQEIINAILSINASETISTFSKIWEPLIYPMSIGGMILGPVFAIPTYLITKRATEMFKQKNKKKITEKAKAIRQIIADKKNARKQK